MDAYASIVQFYYARKAKEYDALATVGKSEREQTFVMFAAKMEEELSQFPFVSFICCKTATDKNDGDAISRNGTK